MRQAVTILFAAVLALGLRPALAQQSPAAATMPPGTQNPALSRPQMVSPLIPGTQPNAPQPADSQPGTPGDQATPNAPAGPVGLCECLVNHDPNVATLDKTIMHRSCSANVGACEAMCNTQKDYSFIPDATLSCPGQPQEQNGHIVMNFTPAVRLLSRR